MSAVKWLGLGLGSMSAVKWLGLVLCGQVNKSIKYENTMWFVYSRVGGFGGHRMFEDVFYRGGIWGLQDGSNWIICYPINHGILLHRHESIGGRSRQNGLIHQVHFCTIFWLERREMYLRRVCRATLRFPFHEQHQSAIQVRFKPTSNLHQFHNEM